MQDYCRASHEFLLLGARANLPFRDSACRSWLLILHTVHIRQPCSFRELIERVSSRPYWELAGRERQANSDGTVYGNQVERQWF